MAARNIIKQMTVSVDGRGYAGEVTEYTPPVLTLATEDHRAGGMDAPIALDMGMEALETSFILTAYDADVLAQFGVSEGNAVPFVGRGAMQSYDGTWRPTVHTMRGKIVSIDRGTWQPGQRSTMTVTLRLDYYREEHDGRLVHEIDIENMVRTVDGVDALQGLRNSLRL
ncbi:MULTISPECIES: phage major tail tube protein [unclassified Halomonas]|uniref:phage major tail tube protein n=1 Tax=unclassified Halomonas TaxID=2609666 RepID=UPI002888318A|nr:MULTISPECIES: phage major tail tube protein [unclassified Halomonas]MDT0499720.1 phage major tail tube protein [Halomonas sp. PAR7]MDT0510463.1 phage major tail tube protein [Halomonas sp. LES1]MDT0589828.1 phage major tail tube protein [Halomonas sp. PAR8]